MTSYKIDPSPQVLYVQDEEGRENSLMQPLSQDGSHQLFRFWPMVLLMSYVSMGVRPVA